MKNGKVIVSQTIDKSEYVESLQGSIADNQANVDSLQAQIDQINEVIADLQAKIGAVQK